MQIKIREKTIPTQSKNKNLDGYKILHISDIHFKEFMNDTDTFRLLSSTKMADLVLITGDFITTDNDIEPAVNFLKQLQSNDGIYAILGNHDYVYSTIIEHFVMSRIRGDIKNNVKKLVDSIRKIGINMLINESALLETRGARIFIEGTDDPAIGNPKISEKNEQYEISDLKILLTHSPDMLYLDDYAKKDFDIVLCGHTHGGQIRLPFLGPLFTSTKYAPRNECYGLFKKKKSIVHVSAGIGYSALPIRINCPSEITVFTLKIKS